MKKILTSLIVIGLVFTLFSCKNESVIEKTIIEQNNTHETIIIDEIDIHNLELAVNKAFIKANNSIIAVKRCFEVMSSGINVLETEANGSGIIYKRIDNYIDNELVDYTYYVITNYHVLKGDNEYHTYHHFAYLGLDKPDYPLTIVGFDSSNDIALCSFNSTYYLEAVTFGEDFSTGDFVINVGTTHNLDLYNSLTFGVISNPKRVVLTDTDNDGVKDSYLFAIQTDSAINHGNSGGGLFNLEGELIGITTLKRTTNEAENIGFSLRIDYCLPIIECLMNHTTYNRYKLNITSFDIRNIQADTFNKYDLANLPDIYQDVRYGLLVYTVSAESIFSSYNLEKNDIILEFEDEKIYSITQIIDIFSKTLKTTFKVKYYDASEEIIKDIVINFGVNHD